MEYAGRKPTTDEERTIHELSPLYLCFHKRTAFADVFGFGTDKIIACGIAPVEERRTVVSYFRTLPNGRFHLLNGL